MSNNSMSSGPRSKNACEPCRRKKTKCPGEQPVCSFCRRLNQRCTYTHQSNTARVSKSRNDSSNTQISRLQAQIDQMNRILQSLTNQSRSNLNNDPHEQPSFSQNDNSMVPSFSSLQTSSHSSLRLSPHPSPEVMSELIEIYRIKIHCLPLALFDTDHLSTQWPKWPHYLLQSFLAATLAFSGPTRSDTMEAAFRMARAAVIPAASEGMTSASILQSLCLLTVYDIAAGNESRGSMNISIMTNLVRSVTQGSKTANREKPPLGEDKARCCWAVFILERAFTRGPWMLKLDYAPMKSLPHIPSPETPPAIHDTESSNTLADSTDMNTDTHRDRNIFHSCVSLLSVWGKIIEYSTQVKAGQSDEAWLASSTYSNIGSDFYNFETSLAQIHRFKNISLTSRPLEEISQHSEYWSYWLLLQTTFHTGHALLNHPLLHALGHDRSANKRTLFRPPSFLQQTIDQAILHAGWTPRLVSTAKDMGIRINDPIIGHQVIISATIHWIFSFASDSSIAERAISDLDQCLQLVREISTSWPRFAEKVSALQQLQNLTRQTYGVLGKRGLPASITSILWNLIDPCSTSMDLTLSPDFISAGDRVPTEHLAQLHENPQSNSQQHLHDLQRTDVSQASVEFMHYSGLMMDEDLVYPGAVFEPLDFRFLGDFGSLGGL